MEQQKFNDLPPLIEGPELSNELKGGPKFGEYDGWKKKISKWLRKHSPVIILIIIIIIVLGSGIYFGQKEKQTTAEQQKTSEILAEEITSNITTDTIVETAKKGEGITHLARRALSDCLAEQNTNVIELSPEQQIYVEDYLQNEIGSRPLRIGDEISFSKDLLQEAIDASLALTNSQINTLSKYVPLVPSLAMK